MKTTTLSRQNIVKLLNLNNNRKITKFQLWWNTMVTNDWEVRDFVITDANAIKEHNTVYVMLFEKRHSSRGKEVYIRNYWLNLKLRNSNNIEDIAIINDDAPNKISEIINTFHRKGYLSIVAYAKKGSKTHEFFRSRRYLDFSYSLERSAISNYKTGDKRDILVKVINH